MAFLNVHLPELTEQSISSRVIVQHVIDMWWVARAVMPFDDFHFSIEKRSESRIEGLVHET
jgi:hypothetical protein